MAAAQVGGLLAERGCRTIYGGGNVGLMGILADAALAAGGEIIGVIPQALVKRELAHQGCTELRIVNSMHERKFVMADLADAFLALPGGWGTFEELCETLTWIQLGIHSKPCGLLNVCGYFDPLIAMFDRAVEERFLKPQYRELLIVEEDPAAVLDRLKSARRPAIPRWLEPEAR
jgi:hypothetical protein